MAAQESATAQRVQAAVEAQVAQAEAVVARVTDYRDEDVRVTARRANICPIPPA